VTAPALDLAARAAPDPAGDALVEADGATLTWSALAARAAAARRRIDAEAAARGLGPSDPVAFVAHARPETFVVVHALVAAGRPLLPIHPRLDHAAAAALAAALGAGVVLDAAALDAGVRAGRGARDHAAFGDVSSEAARSGSPSCAAPPDDERPLAILATSGTSAAPKGVILPRRAFAGAAAASAANLPLGRRHRWLACMPLAHAGGLSILTRTLAAGAGVVLLPRFDPGAVLEAIVTQRATHLSAVPTMLRALLDHPARRALTALDALLVGGAACPSAWLAEARDEGIAALATYGLTEACSQVTTQPLTDARRAPDGDSGLPIAGTDVVVVGADGAPVLPGREGAIAVRGPGLMTGYVGRPPLPRGALHATGDVGALRPDGRLVVLARRTDLIVTGGENVSPAAVEVALTAVPGVVEAAVFGVPDPRWGERVAAVVVLAPGADLGRCLEAASARLPPHARPRLAVEADASLPRTTKGEVDRAAARARWAAASRPVGR
jgi:O-succinylbenzoic acid--CoA ligase